MAVRHDPERQGTTVGVLRRRQRDWPDGRVLQWQRRGLPRLRPVRAAPTMSTVTQTAVHIAKACCAGKGRGPLI